MSSAPQSPSLPASSSTPTATHAAQAVSSYHVFQATPSNGSFSRTASVSEAPTPAPQTEVESPAANHVEEPPKPVTTVDVQAISDEVWRRGKTKGRRQEEVDAMQQTAVRIATKLSADHATVLHPDIDSPFTSAADAVERLLPYHIYQHPLEDLFAFTHPNRKGKRKASAEDLIREEIKDTRFALQCWKRKTALEKKFREIRIRSGKRTASDDQAYILAHCVLEADRAENAVLNVEYRNARSELDALERKRKLEAQQKARAAVAAAASVSSRPSPSTPQPSSSSSSFSVTNTTQSTSNYATTSSTTPSYSVTASSAKSSYTPTTSTTASSSYSQYRGYTYPYPQSYGSAYSYSPFTNAYNNTTQSYTQSTPQQPIAPAPQDLQRRSEPHSYTSTLHTPSGGATSTQVQTPELAQTPIAARSSPQRTAISATTTATAVAPATSPQPTFSSATSMPTTPLTVSLPVAALTTLSTMGIVPVPAANVPPADQPRPAAVIKGTTQNGTMVSLEFNLAALQATQAGALLMVLSALTSRGTNISSASSGGTSTSTAAASPTTGTGATAVATDGGAGNSSSAGHTAQRDSIQSTVSSEGAG